MEGIEEYTLLSKKILSDDDLGKIHGVVREDEISCGISWIGDRRYAEKNPEGNYEYTLTCTRLTEQARIQLNKLELKLIPILEPEPEKKEPLPRSFEEYHEF